MGNRAKKTMKLYKTKNLFALVAKQKIVMRIVFIISILFPSYLVAASDKETINQILATYNLECSVEAGSVEKGDLITEIIPVTLGSGSIYEIEITTGGKKATVLFSDFKCLEKRSFWCGSGGCSVYIIVDGKMHHKSRGFKPFSVQKDDRAFVMLPVSGGVCRMRNGAPCYGVMIWDEYGQKFNSVDN